MSKKLYEKAFGNEKKFVDLCRLQLQGKDYVVISNNKSKYKIDVLIMKNNRETIISTVEFEVISEEGYNPIKPDKTPRFKDLHCPIEKKEMLLNEKNTWYVRVNKEFNEKIDSLDSLVNLGNTVLGYVIKGTRLKKYPTEQTLAYTPKDNFTKKIKREFIQCYPKDINCKIGTVIELIDFIYERLGIIKIQNTKKLSGWFLNV